MATPQGDQAGVSLIDVAGERQTARQPVDERAEPDALDGAVEHDAVAARLHDVITSVRIADARFYAFPAGSCRICIVGPGRRRGGLFVDEAGLPQKVIDACTAERLGNVVMSDDANAPYRMQQLMAQCEFPPCVEVADLGTPGLDLALHLSSAHIVGASFDHGTTLNCGRSRPDPFARRGGAAGGHGVERDVDTARTGRAAPHVVGVARRARMRRVVTR